MIWRIGWILDTLNYRIEKDFRESIYLNEGYRENRWSAIERQILIWSSSPIKYVFLLWLSCIFWMLFLSLSLPEIKKLFPAWHQPWHDLVSWQTTFFTGQLTMTGLVFPLVIGFVGITLSGKSANRALWKIYRHYSGFMFVGLSSLALLAMIILGQFIHPWLPLHGDTIFAVGTSFWLIFNAITLGWFLYATATFLSTDSRSTLVLRYCINEALTAEIEARLSKVWPQRVMESNSSEETSEPYVGTFMYSAKGGKEYKLKFKSNRYLCNIYFRPLKVAAWIWKFRAKRIPGDKSCRLILPISGKVDSAKSWDLAIHENCHLCWVEKFLIRHSYSFGKSPQIETSNLMPVIQVLAGSIDDSLADGKERLFKLALREMENWHADILAAAAFTNDNRDADNWLLLADGSFFGTSLQDELSREYYLICQSVLQILPRSDRYFYSYCYLHLRIYLRNKGKLADRIVEQLMRGHHHIWPALMNWHRHSKPSGSHSVPDHSFESAIRLFIGSWERWAKEFTPEIDNWAKSRKAVGHLLLHLEHSAHQIISAIRCNEMGAAEWATDMMVHWYENSCAHRMPHQYSWNKDLLVHPLLGTDISAPIWKQILAGQELVENDAALIALSNAWFDVRLAVAAYILNRNSENFTPKIQEILHSLIFGKRLKPSSSVHVAHHRVTRGADILQAYIRQGWIGLPNDRSYSRWMDSIVELFERSEEDDHITGRVYSSIGNKDIRSLKDSYKTFAISLSGAEWSISSAVLSLFSSASVTLQNREELVRELKIWESVSKETIEQTKSFMGKEYSPGHLDNFKASIKKLATQIENKNIQEVIDAPLDEELLDNIGIEVSTVPFASTASTFPLSLFSNINFIEEIDDKYKRTPSITGYHRSQFAKNIVTDRVGEDTEWLSNIISGDIAVTLFRRLYAMPNLISASFSEARKLLERSIGDSRLLSEEANTTVLLVGPLKIRELLEVALWDAHEKEGRLPYSVRKDDGYPDDYICHMEGIEVYRTPFNDDINCVLTTKELFENVYFRTIKEGQNVDAKFIIDEKDPIRGSLELSYWVMATFGENTVFRYVLEGDRSED